MPATNGRRPWEMESGGPWSSEMKKSVFVLAAMATALALAPAAFAGNLTTDINFTCSGQGVAGPGSKTLPIGGGCTAAGGSEGLASYTPLATWRQQAESGGLHYAVLSSAGVDINGTSNSNGSFLAKAWDYDGSDGFNWSGQSNATGVSGVPSLHNALIPSATDQLEVIYNNSQSLFYLDGFYLGENKTSDLDYMIFGYNGSKLVYCIDSDGNSCSGSLSGDWDTLGTVTDPGGIYYTDVSNPDWYIPVTSVYIDTKQSSVANNRLPYDYLDNIQVTQTPEPSELVLFGTGFGLLGLGLFLRRRFTLAAVRHSSIA